VILVVDIDDTICFPNHAEKETRAKYSNANPNIPVIAKLREAKQAGCKIVLYTARRMLTHNGDVQKVIEDVGHVTEEWLHAHQVPYDDLIFGKPYGDMYVDDKAGNSIALLLTMRFDKCPESFQS
jgi:capsule biosynthesis phosphatase